MASTFSDYLDEWFAQQGKKKKDEDSLQIGDRNGDYSITINPNNMALQSTVQGGDRNNYYSPISNRQPVNNVSNQPAYVSSNPNYKPYQEFVNAVQNHVQPPEPQQVEQPAPAEELPSAEEIQEETPAVEETEAQETPSEESPAENTDGTAKEAPAPKPVVQQAKARSNLQDILGGNTTVSSLTGTKTEDKYGDLRNLYNDKNAMVNDPQYQQKFYLGLRQKGLNDGEARNVMENLGVANNVTTAKSNHYIDLFKKALQGGNISEMDMVLANAFANGAGDKVIQSLGLMNPHYKDVWTADRNMEDYVKKADVNHNVWEKEAATKHGYEQENIKLQSDLGLRNYLTQLDAQVAKYKEQKRFDIANAIEANKARLNYFMNDLGMPKDIAVRMTVGTDGKGLGGNSKSSSNGSSSGGDYKKNEELNHAQDAFKKFLERKALENEGVLPKDIKDDPEYQWHINYISGLEDLAKKSVDNEQSRQFLGQFNFRTDKDNNMYLDDFNEACRFASGILRQVQNGEVSSTVGGSTIENVCGDQANAVFDAIGWYDGVNKVASQPKSDESLEERKRRAGDVASSSYAW